MAWTVYKTEISAAEAYKDTIMLTCAIHDSLQQLLDVVFRYMQNNQGLVFSVEADSIYHDFDS